MLLPPETADGGCMPYAIKSDERIRVYDPRLPHWFNVLKKWSQDVFEYFSHQLPSTFFLASALCVVIGTWALWSWAAALLALGVMLLLLSFLWDSGEPPPPFGIHQL
jgi:hypothetical protein